MVRQFLPKHPSPYCNSDAAGDLALNHDMVIAYQCPLSTTIATLHMSSCGNWAFQHHTSGFRPSSGGSFATASAQQSVDAALTKGREVFIFDTHQEFYAWAAQAGIRRKEARCITKP